MSMANISSTNRGFPSAASKISLRVSSDSKAPPRRFSRSVALSFWSRGSRSSDVAFNLPPAHAGR